MPISKEEVVRIVLKTITGNLGIPQPMASDLTELVVTYLINKAIDPTIESIREATIKIMNENQPTDRQTTQAQDKVITVEELLERANKDSAKDAGIHVAKSHVDLFMQIRSEFQVSGDEMLLSTNISKASNIPTQVKQQVVELQAKFGKIIDSVAVYIEEKKYETAEQAIAEMQEKQQVSIIQKEMMQKLVSSDKTFHISCQSLKVTVDFFAALNEYVIQEIEACSNLDQESRLVLGNAVLVYELTDFVIKYLQSFKVEGVVGIQSIKNEIDRKIQKLETEIQALKAKTDRKEIFKEVRDNILSNIAEREEAVSMMQEAWVEYLGEVKSISDDSTSFITKWIPNLELIRDDAKNQIGVLEILTIVRALKGNLIALKTAVTRLETMKLVSLSPDRVRRLLGV
ncbi:MAG: hypothetical protein AAGA60_00865 [Cyanobacteria bacterium P01_E01_bin.42]